MAAKKFKTLLTRQTIAKRVTALGRAISKHYGETKQPLLVVGILKGSFIFLADLVRALKIPCEVDFIEVSSYGAGTTSSGQVTLTRDLPITLRNRDVLIVEDIVDTGLTMRHLLEHLSRRHPKSLAVCSLLDKPSRRKTQVEVDFLGFTIEDHFVVGYGLDCNNRFREMDSVVIYDPQAK